MRAFRFMLPASLLATPVIAADGGAIEVKVANVRSAEGEVMVQLCPREQFLGKCAIGTHVAAKAGEVVVIFPHVPPGDYAAMAFHDRNANGTLDRRLGIPREDFGFSRMAKLPFGPPRFRDAVFTHDGADQKLEIKLGGYFG